MSAVEIAVAMDEQLVRKLDLMVLENVYPNRSMAIESAVHDMIFRSDKGLLARECAKLDPAEEQAMAERGFAASVPTWPEY